MSYVTTVVIFCPYIPEATAAKLKEGFVANDGRRVWFSELTEHRTGEGEVDLWSYWAGTRGPEADVFGGAFNFLNPGELLRWLEGLHWYGEVGVMLETNGESGLQVWTVGKAS